MSGIRIRNPLSISVLGRRENVKKKKKMCQTLSIALDWPAALIYLSGSVSSHFRLFKSL